MSEETLKLFADYGLPGLMVGVSYMILTYIIYQQNKTIKSKDDNIKQSSDKILDMLDDKDDKDDCCNK